VSARRLSAAALAVVLTACAGAARPAAAPAPREGWVAAEGGVRLYWRTLGSGPDTVIVLHGGPGLGMGTVLPDLGPLAAGRTLLFYDQAGAGRSGPVDDTLRLAAPRHVADLEAVRRHFGLDRVTLLGATWGAAIAAMYAAEHPERVERLVLLSPYPVARDPDFGRYVENVLARVGPRAAERMAAVQAEQATAADPLASCREYYAILLPRFLADSASMSRLRADPCDAPPESARRTFAQSDYQIASLGAWDFRPALARVAAPALVVWGEADALPREAAAGWVAAFPNAALLAVPGAGHFPHTERPERVFPALDDFLSGRWPAGAAPVRGAATTPARR
jgi:proline iminopeptidase